MDRCPVCESGAVRTLAGPTDDARQRLVAFSERRYQGYLSDLARTIDLRVLTCAECSHCWYAEIPDEATLSGMYAAAVSFSGRTEAAVRDYATPTAAMIDRMRRIRDLVRSESGVRSDQPSLLDYGSGTGRWAMAAARAGLAVTAFEPHGHRIAQFDKQLEQLDASDSLNGRHFDVIHLEQVLEHVPDPLQLVRDLRACTHPGTVVVIRVPNLAREAASDRDLWRAWPYDGQKPHIMAPYEHIHGFTPRSLKALITGAGLAPLSLSAVARHFPRHALLRAARRLHGALGDTQMFASPAA